MTKLQVSATTSEDRTRFEYGLVEPGYGVLHTRRLSRIAFYAALAAPSNGDVKSTKIVDVGIDEEKLQRDHPRAEVVSIDWPQIPAEEMLSSGLRLTGYHDTVLVMSERTRFANHYRYFAYRGDTQVKEFGKRIQASWVALRRTKKLDLVGSAEFVPVAFGESAEELAPWTNATGVLPLKVRWCETYGEATEGKGRSI